MASNSTMLTKRSAAGALMPPPPAPKRITRPSVVLDEDTYVSAVSHIIRRDFFPGLAESDAQREYLNALESKDKAWIRESGKKLTQVMTPVPHGQRRAADRTRFSRPGGASSTDKTPSVWGADTPVTVAGTGADEEHEDGLGKLDKVDLDMSLNAFQAKYTSEDQESFSAIIDKQNQKKFEKNTWLHDGNRYASKQRLAQQKVLAANAASDSQALTVRPSQNLDDRPAAPTMHKHTAFNTLMFNPDSVESWASTNVARAESASLAPPRQTRYANTRLPAETEPLPRPASPTLSAIRDAVSGKPRLGASEGGYTGSETPRVNGYAFVDAQAPESDDEDAPEDLLERFGVTGESASKATPFSMAEASEREKMHHKMVDQIGAKRAEGASNRAGPAGKGLGIFTSETPRFLSAPTPATRLAAQTPGRKGKGDLTPAAQRLLERMGKTPRGNGAGGFGSRSGKGQDWTPVSRAKRKP
ncbi:hypothetical protein BU25DRAFT_405283 [Macroventuria anomochaeta]|uniref:Uncharacterized protein n=1 Tax=Macroventuria anomochaeta TaxID=301207 RepID=A0ACB6SIY1_9PLEO|nr:uncharacterized protein BU25DRAFT_405283 [Macroventuria anomochaeta]KAF2633383.1 hypothetical protein BU25DRAFT_405283 [Macroventuria anomochaeta]